MVDHAREFERRYRGTWVGVRSDKRVIPRRVEAIREGNLKSVIQWVFNNEDRLNTSVIPKNIDTVLQLLPTTFGMMEISGALYYLFKMPHRQFKAGYHSENMSLYSLQSQELRMIGKKPSNVESQGLLTFIFNPAYHSLEDGLKPIRKGVTMGFALNKKFGVGLVRGFPHECVFYKAYNLGSLDNDNVLILEPQHHHLIEELSQYIQCRLGGKV